MTPLGWSSSSISPTVPSDAFAEFKTTCRDEIDKPLLEELFPLGQVIHDVHWESHDGHTRLPVHETDLHRAPEVHGKAGITFGRQIGAYPILVGVEYKIPLETQSSVMITGHGARSITGVEVGLDPMTVSEKQLEAIPGIGKKSAWATAPDASRPAMASSHAADKRRAACLSWSTVFTPVPCGGA